MMNWGCVIKDAVCRISASFVAEIGTYIENEVGDWKRGKEVLMAKVSQCYRGELDSIPVSATEFLCDVGQVI